MQGTGAGGLEAEETVVGSSVTSATRRLMRGLVGIFRSLDVGRMSEDDKFMHRAIELSAVAERQGNLPVGAVISLDGEVVTLPPFFQERIENTHQRFLNGKWPEEAV